MLRSVGITPEGLFKNKGFLINPPMSRGQLCGIHRAPTADAERTVAGDYGSCSLPRPLNVLIIHNHCPLFTRYGSDKRLYHIAESFRALGHDVHFGGMEVSGYETEDDHMRIKALGARLYSPLTKKIEDELFVDRVKLEEMLREVYPDIILMTLWFWNVPPVTRLFFGPVR